MKSILFFLVLAVAPVSLAKTYKLKSSWSGQNLLNQFTFENAPSDNSGIAMYNSYASAKKKGLISVNKKGAVTLRVSTVQQQSKRDSLRLVSKASYSNGGLFIFDVAHIPAAMGAWPAIWFTGPNWPTDGEIDVIEGVHETNMNAMSTHTGPGCTQIPSGFTGQFMMTSSNKNVCNVYATSAQGCGVRSASTTSYGPNFNAKGGGVFALLWDSTGLRTYHWTRSSIPSDIKSGKPKPSGWGTPENFVHASACGSQNFKNMMMVINTNLCGTWAGTVWNDDLTYAGSPGSPAKKTGYSTCNAYVQNNGAAMAQAYWTINSIKQYR